MRIRLLTFLILFCTGVFAQQIKIEDAQKIAENFICSLKNGQASSRKKMMQMHPRLQLTYTAMDEDNALYYIFNNKEGGFVVTSGDKRAEEILAYSENGSFDIQTANPNLKFWLKGYEKRISETIKHNLPIKAKDEIDAPKKDVPILIKTHWGQDLPYNKVIRATTSKSYPTGCIATAMSQVMKYYEWPKNGTGSHSYYDSECSKRSYSRNFDHPYNWEDMLNEYSNGAYSSTQADAVAELMFDTGVSVNMEYGLTGSGTYTEQVPYAMVHHFGYDKGIAHAYRSYYSDEEWEELIYTELADGRPVMYGGCTSEDEGHEFICDGYQASTDKYHFNWGWEGDGDCYCVLSAVKCKGYLFNEYQDIVYGIQKPCDGKGKLNIVLYDDCFLEASKTESEGYTTYELSFDKNNFGIILNDSYMSGDVLFNMMFENQRTGKSYIPTPRNIADNKIHFEGVYVESKLFSDFDGFMRITVKDLKIPELPSGDYRIYLVYKNWEDRNNNSVEWVKVRSFISKKNYIEETIESKLEIPIAMEAKDVKNDGFTASWFPVKDAESYSILLTSKKKEVSSFQLINEGFTTLDSEKYDGLIDISSKLDEYTNDNGWSGDKVFSSVSRVKLGTPLVGGCLTTPNLKSDGIVTVTIEENVFENDSTLVTVEIGQTKESFLANGKQHEIKTEIDGEFNVKISTKGSKQRVYINHVNVLVEEYEKNSTIIDNLKDTVYTFSELDNSFDYTYKVRTHANDDESKWSNEVTVILSEEDDRIIEVNQSSVNVLYENNAWTIKGLREDTEVSIYSPVGILIGKTKSKNGLAKIPSSSKNEEIVVIKINNSPTIKCHK